MWACICHNTHTHTHTCGGQGTILWSWIPCFWDCIRVTRLIEQRFTH